MADAFEDEAEPTITIGEYIEEIEAAEREADLVLGGDEGNECTYASGYMKRQAIFSCLTCVPGGNAGVCTACSLSCHDGHEIVELWTKRKFRCDCGNSKFGDFVCKLYANKDPENPENSYNHNFKGAYCTCGRPYPDPDVEEEVEMIQCCICEDWFHENHLGLNNIDEIIKLGGFMSPSPSSTGLLVLLLVFVVVVCKKTLHASALNATTTMGTSPQKMERIQKYLEKINKPAVKSIKSPDGDIIDCVHMNKQLALDHPLLKNHKIQRVAPKRPASHSEADNQQPRNETVYRARQAWNLVENCPNGTVSVRRTTVDDVLRAGSLSRFGKKKVYKGPASNPYTGFEYAVAQVNQQQAYGTQATIDVWNPSVENSGEFSLSQIWLIAGSYAASDLNAVEAGWQVFPELYGDSQTRLFIYWTSGAYVRTGCYNLMCPGFVQISNEVAVGAAFARVSTYNGRQYEITLLVWKDTISGNWWLSYENIDVGYWPAEILTLLTIYATTVDWGGEIVNWDVNWQHTATQMGSGHFAEEGYQKASYFRNVEVVNSANALRLPYAISTIAGNPNCYDIQTFFAASWGFYFFYGGPGRNPNCP